MVSIDVWFMMWTWFLTVFFFFKQKTAYEMRISDWSSDVCSSDLLGERWRFFGRLRHRLADELLEYGQQLRGVGVLEIDDPDFGPARRLVVEFARERGKPGDARRIAAQGDAVRTVDRHRDHARSHRGAPIGACRAATAASKLLERFGNFAGARILECHDLGRVVGDRKSTRLNSSH